MATAKAKPAVPRVKGPIVEKREITAIRIPPSQKAEIKARADSYRMTFTEYVIRCALGEPLATDTLEDRVQNIEERLDRLEERAYISS